MVSLLKLVSLTIGMLALLLILLYYNDEKHVLDVAETGSIQVILLLLSSLLATVIAYLAMVCNQISERKKEFFIRKLYGANSMEIVLIVVAEACMYLLLAFAISLSVLDQFLPLLNRLTSREVSFRNIQGEVELITSTFIFIIPVFIVMLLPAMRCAKPRAVDLLKKLSA